MDVQRLAADWGHALATSIAAHSAIIEAGITNSPIHAYPVSLEPAFRPFDPLQTFERAGQRPSSSTSPAPTEWVMQQLILPANDAVDWSQAEAFLAGLAGLDGPLSFELYADHTSASFYLGAPAQQHEFVAHNWLSAYPESALTQAPDPCQTLKHAASLVLVDLYSPAPYHRSMRTHPALTPWRQLLRLCNTIASEDLLFAQIIFTPAKQSWHHNIAAIIHAERLLGARAPQGHTSHPKNPAEPIFAAVVRIGCTNPALARGIEAFTGNFTADGEPFSYRTMKDYQRILSMQAIRRFLTERTSHTTGQLLTTSELGNFVHPPDHGSGESVHVRFLQGLPVPPRLRDSGMPLGTNQNRGEPINVFQPLHLHNQSAWLIGASRMGKSTMIIHRALHLARAGRGVGLLDPHRTTAFDLLHTLEGIAPERIVFLDFDANMPVAYNPFADHDADDYGRLTTEYVNSLKTLFDAERFHRMSHVLGMAVYALFVLKENLATLPELLAKTPRGESLRRRVIASVHNEAVRRFFDEEYHTYTSETFAPLTNRMSAVFLDDKTHRTFAQTHNAIDIAGAMDAGQIVLVAPPASIEAAKIVGGLLIAQARHAAFRRAGTPRAKQHFHLIIDEFHRFITSANTLQSIIDETAKGGLSVCLANQETGQIPDDLLKAMYSIPNIIVFGVNLPDAKALAHVFSGVTPETLAGQRTGEAHARISGDIANFTVPPPRNNQSSAVAAAIISHSQAHYYANPASNAPASARRARRVIDTIEE